MTITLRWLSTLAAFALLLTSPLFTHTAFAAPPVLSEIKEQPLRNAYQDKGTYTLRLNYRDADGDAVKKAKFVDDSRGGKVGFDVKEIPAGNPEDGIVLEWEIKDFDKGSHQAYFEVTNNAGEVARFPKDETAFYGFKVESVSDKWIVMVAGGLICLGLLPFLVYLIARSTNRQGNPSSAARIGLIVGIVATLGLFLYEFIGTYDNPLIYALAGIAAIALFIIVLTRR